MPIIEEEVLQVGFAQVAPVWLDRRRTLDKVMVAADEAGAAGCHLLAFGEALIPGYPFWLEYTDGARFNDPRQKEMHALYMREAVQIEAGHLDPVCEIARSYGMMILVGTIERPPDRGGHSLYCTLVTISIQGEIVTTHRKLMPTYEERLVWSPGDGHGLRVNRLGAFTVGGLNCWENWMPLPRAALYAQGEDLHVAVWPGNLRNTELATRFIAQEGRSYALSVSALMRQEDFPAETPMLAEILAGSPAFLANGGSCLAAPDGTWLIEPLVKQEGVRWATIDHRRVREERQNYDPAGHYARPDVTTLVLNRERQSTLRIVE
jgi:nitrilase